MRWMKRLITAWLIGTPAGDSYSVRVHKKVLCEDYTILLENWRGFWASFWAWFRTWFTVYVRCKRPVSTVSIDIKEMPLVDYFCDTCWHHAQVPKDFPVLLPCAECDMGELLTLAQLEEQTRC